MGNTVDSVGAEVLEVLGEVLSQDPEALRAQPVLAGYDWDSLASLEALAQLESAFGVRLDLRAFQAVRTVEEMAALVAATLNS
ncbi:acyl carrier protein [Kitasatospora sp. GAS204B]|uniref:acyl carrier protein n=1 Tax=unclassified Kitasatospora TaxID=2633591 RepID=UPI00247694E7|nr:acyl carrier protein [Kitasatospora sp. GAS204B]MDH6123006.1 acyl carrier protein [Kitasatospora sp. GAS204B]